jgi:crotonobetainyl-CoA:carnitine CoA-transferase CaiB-like acyl-CoA transferase
MEKRKYMLPLEGIRVLDFGRVLSAPYGTMALADLGADVVKIEHPKRGDDTRSFGPPFVDDVSTYFLSINRGKRSVVLDLKKEEDRLVAKKLALKADVLVENFRSGVMERLGLGFEELMREHPRLICCSLTGFGRKEGARPGYDLMMQGLSGIPSITGPVDGEPYKCGASVADLVAGMNLTQGILTALFQRERTGKGGIVDVSMMDGMLSLLTYHASAYLNAGVAPERRGNGHPSIHPFQPYRCSDGFLTICIGNDALFQNFATALGRIDLQKDTRFQTNPLRVQYRDDLDEIIIPILLSKTKSEWKKVFVKQGVPADIVATVPEALERASTVSHEHPNGVGTVQSLALPFGIDDFPRAAKRRAPRLGEHNQEVQEEWLSN